MFIVFSFSFILRSKTIFINVSELLPVRISYTFPSVLLRHRTDPSNPMAVPNRYAEFPRNGPYEAEKARFWQ